MWPSFWPFTFQWSKQKTCGQNLKCAAQEFKKRHDKEMELRRLASNEALLDEIRNSQISSFFTESKPSLSMQGIFNTTEMSFLIKELRKRQALIKTETSTTDNSAILKPEKALKLDDYRELPELGLAEGNNSVNKHCLYFTASETLSGFKAFHISLIERTTGSKRMQDRKTGAQELVPCIKKKIHTMLIGSERTDGSFSWQRITNDASSTLQEPSPESPPSPLTTNRQVRFQEN